jgi:putative redox protein
MYASRHGWEIGPLHVDLMISRAGADERIERTVKVSPTVTPEQRARLAKIAEKTPVTKTLKRATTIATTFAVI